jgi:hypothetical protein
VLYSMLSLREENVHLITRFRDFLTEKRAVSSRAIDSTASSTPTALLSGPYLATFLARSAVFKAETTCAEERDFLAL